jgi:hypothetical protein
MLRPARRRFPTASRIATIWNVGIGITQRVFTLDFRYYDTDLNKGDCNAFTNDHTATFTASFTPINAPTGAASLSS